MANDVFANGREISCKKADGKTICEFPDVCFTPPENPAAPPGVPVPYPNTAFAKDTLDGSRTVKISGEEVMLKNKSYFKTSTGDEAGSAAKKGIITSKNKGKAYFISWSQDVKIEAENVDRHLDMTTHNHASIPANGSAPFPELDTMYLGGKNCEEIFKKEHINVHRHGEKKCPDGYESDHILQNACFENSRGIGGITTCPKYNVNDAPCICLKGKSTENGSQHFKKTQAQVNMQKKWKGKTKPYKKTVNYKDVRDQNLKAVSDSRSTPPSKAAQKCLKMVVDHYFKDYLGLKDETPVRRPRSGKFRRPLGAPK